MKKILVLGGKPIGSVEIVKGLQKLGCYVVVADYLEKKLSPAKQIANESLDISTADVDLLEKYCLDNNVDGIYTGVHEFNIERMVELCERLQLPCYTTTKQWNLCNNKLYLKEQCIKHDINVAKRYKIESKEDIFNAQIDFPVIIKPVDGSGSRGFSICNDKEDLLKGFDSAVKFSETGRVLVEQKMNYKQSCIVNYTIVDSKVYFSGISDKKSAKVSEKGAPIMSFQSYPSVYQKQYLDNVNDKAIKMIKDMKIINGVIWFEVFVENCKFVFNEMGFRFGGSLTYYPVKAVTNIDQFACQLDYVINGINSIPINPKYDYDKIYCILPVHVKEGIIAKIDGLELLSKETFIKQIVKVHNVGDDIRDWGSAQQVFAYIHFETDNIESVDKVEKLIMDNLKVLDNQGKNLLFNLYHNN